YLSTALAHDVGLTVIAIDSSPSNTQVAQQRTDLLRHGLEQQAARGAFFTERFALSCLQSVRESSWLFVRTVSLAHVSFIARRCVRFCFLPLHSRINQPPCRAPRAALPGTDAQRRRV